MNKFLIALLLLSYSALLLAEDRELAELFAWEGLDGTIVISSLDGKRSFTHNDARAGRRLPVASTFKILNTLIAVEEKTIAGKDGVLKWDGKAYDFTDWNRDQTLESAFKVSCVWCYQALARKVGAEQYRRYLKQANYGALREPFETDKFWLDGSLRASALEQVELLKKIYARRLPFGPHAYATLRQIMQAEKMPSYTLWAKTGWAAQGAPQIGWYVGYLETLKGTWFFATNIDLRSKADLPLRQLLTLEALRVKRIIE